MNWFCLYVVIQQEKAEMKRELWRIEDVMAGLSASKANYKITIDSVQNPGREPKTRGLSAGTGNDNQIGRESLRSNKGLDLNTPCRCIAKNGHMVWYLVFYILCILCCNYYYSESDYVTDFHSLFFCFPVKLGLKLYFSYSFSQCKWIRNSSRAWV